MDAIKRVEQYIFSAFTALLYLLACLRLGFWPEKTEKPSPCTTYYRSTNMVTIDTTVIVRRQRKPKRKVQNHPVGQQTEVLTFLPGAAIYIRRKNTTQNNTAQQREHIGTFFRYFWRYLLNYRIENLGFISAATRNRVVVPPH